MDIPEGLSPTDLLQTACEALKQGTDQEKLTAVACYILLATLILGYEAGTERIAGVAAEVSRETLNEIAKQGSPECLN